MLVCASPHSDERHACPFPHTAEKGVLSSGRLRELRQRYLAGLRAAMPAEAANVTWVVDKVRHA